MRIPSKIVYTEEVIKDNIQELLRNEYVSLTAIQRYFNVGYAKAGRIIDEMFNKGFLIGENTGVPYSAKFDLAKKQQIEDFILKEVMGF